MSLSSIREIVKARAGVTESEFTDSMVDDFINRAVVSLKEDWTLADVAEGSLVENAVILQTMLDILYSRATTASLDYTVSSKELRTERHQIVDNCFRMIARLEESLDELKAKLNLRESEVFVSDLIRSDQAGRLIPDAANAAPEPTALSAVVSNGQVELTWTEMDVRDFSFYQVWYSPVAGIHDPMSFTAQTNSQNGVASTALSAAYIVQRWKVYYRHNPGSGTWHYLVETRDRNGRASFSNEVTVTV